MQTSPKLVVLKLVLFTLEFLAVNNNFKKKRKCKNCPD